MASYVFKPKILPKQSPKKFWKLEKRITTGGIYLITCKINGKSYCGRTKNFFTRWKSHLSELNIGHHSNRQLNEDFKTYGEKCFTFKIILHEENAEKRIAMEIKTIDDLKKLGKSYNILMDKKFRHLLERYDLPDISHEYIL